MKSVLVESRWNGFRVNWIKDEEKTRRGKRERRVIEKAKNVDKAMTTS